MANVLIAYYSRTGNTKHLANCVAEGAKAAGAAVECRPVDQVTPADLVDPDAIVFGSPTYYGAPAAELKKLIDDSVKFHGRLKGKAGGAFACAGVIGGGAETTVRALVDALLIHGCVVQGCHQGGHYGPVCTGKPDERAENECRDLGERVARLAEKLAS